MNKHFTFLGALALSAGLTLQAQNVNQLVVQANKLGAEIQPTLYGHFFEDINFGADGGLYAELIKNRSFEFPDKFAGWEIFGNVTLQDDGPFKRNPHYVRLGNPGHMHKHTGLENGGFFGIGLKANEKYRFTVWARGENQKISVELIDNASMGESQVITQQEVAINSKEWKKYEVILTSPVTFDEKVLADFMAKYGEGGSVEDIANDNLRLYFDCRSGMLSFTLTAPAFVQIYDMSGRQVYAGQAGVGAHEMDMNAYPSGLYIVKVHDKTLKLMKK